ncbi:hypothetical protein ONZ45_g10510 [Pleurotus djamor]|nr:hypothetical protein ONZ45_g10510 [Pleurotus djamor]
MTFKNQQRAGWNAGGYCYSRWSNFSEYRTLANRDDVSHPSTLLPHRTELVTEEKWEHILPEAADDITHIFHHFGHDGTGDIVETWPGFSLDLAWRSGANQPIILRSRHYITILYPDGRTLYLPIAIPTSSIEKLGQKLKGLLTKRE